MKFPVTLRAQRTRKQTSTLVPLRPDLLRALGLPPGKPLCAVVDRGRVILCKPEEAETWERVLEDFPAFFIRQGDAEGRGGGGREWEPARGSEKAARRGGVRGGKKGA